MKDDATVENCSCFEALTLFFRKKALEPHFRCSLQSLWEGYLPTSGGTRQLPDMYESHDDRHGGK